MVKLIQGLHYFGKHNHLFLQINKSYYWKLTSNTIDINHADIPGNLDKVQCNRKGKNENTTTVFIILHIIPPYANKIIKHLKRIKHPIKNVISNNTSSKSHIDYILRKIYIDYLVMKQQSSYDFHDLKYVEFVKSQPDKNVYKYIFKNYSKIFTFNN